MHILSVTSKHYAFSLVELSIVLVILGLLTGGILTGQSLIRASELRAVTTEFQQYQTAINTFQEKYFALPGDMPNATQFWGRADAPTNFTGSQCANPSTNTGTAPATCNGNGDGSLRPPLPDNSDPIEFFRSWQHLANAGLINGNFTGIRGSAGHQHHLLGTNAPTSKVANAGWGLILRRSDAEYQFPNSLDINLLQFGSQVSTDNTNIGGALVPEEAWSIDTKMDDGKPGQGKILTHTRGHTLCPTSNNQDTADYDFTVTDKTCSLLFLLK